MPNIVNRSDIDRAKQEIDRRRREALERHAEELRELEAERAEIETLEKLMSAFASKFAAADAAQAGRSEGGVTPVATDPPSRFARDGTNFGVFARASMNGRF